MRRKYRLTVKPRDYQVEAAEWALSRKRAVIVMPTGSGKTLISILWVKKLLEEGYARRVLFLEPTRILVEQTAKYIRKVLGEQAVPIHGRYPPSKRKNYWKRARIAVATPETAYNDYEDIVREGYDAIVVDECHHTTGKDAYMKFMEKTHNIFKWRLGLTAYIPPSRKREIEDVIGVIREWHWSDERIKKYVPEWIGEIYEAELNNAEKKVLEILEETRLSYTGRERMLVNLAIRWYVRDGALALKESLEKETKLSSLLSHVKPLLQRRGVRPLHKLDALKRILRDHEGFQKAIVFVDRVIVCQRLIEELREYNPVAIYGKAKMREDIRKILRKAHEEKTKIVVSTSAGEEGLDLPEADLLIIWSNVASPLRFIQRHGRILRLTGKKGLKFVAYIVTPDTPDMDSLIDSLEMARRSGVDVPVDEEVLEALWRRTTRNRILVVLEDKPLPEEWISELVNMPLDMVREGLRKLAQRGMVYYIYTYHGKTFFTENSLHQLLEEYNEYLDPDDTLIAKIKAYTDNLEHKAVSGTYHRVINKLKTLLKKHGYFTRITAILQVPLPTGALQQVVLHYIFRINDPSILEIILRNIYSAKKLVETPLFKL